MRLRGFPGRTVTHLPSFWTPATLLKEELIRDLSEGRHEHHAAEFIHTGLGVVKSLVIIGQYLVWLQETPETDSSVEVVEHLYHQVSHIHAVAHLLGVVCKETTSNLIQTNNHNK